MSSDFDARSWHYSSYDFCSDCITFCLNTVWTNVIDFYIWSSRVKSSKSDIFLKLDVEFEFLVNKSFEFEDIIVNLVTESENSRLNSLYTSMDTFVETPEDIKDRVDSVIDAIMLYPRHCNVIYSAFKDSESYAECSSYIEDLSEIYNSDPFSQTGLYEIM